MTNIVTYVRFANTGNNSSIPNQRAALAGIGATAAGESIDIAMSGSVAKRPELEALLEHIDRNPGTIVLVCAAATLARSLEAFQAIQALFAKAGAKLVVAG